ncbi:CAAX amino protease [Aliterella atlantica]|uniref:CAAX protease n=1 Tax=Aliterella atlantica CENA595 TaxID=1618023 RepID=A0A0D8ZQQ3_9CYAN|nr:CAAX amino protease [Aliterella atlantica]KJH71065.1 CAAX protease [Aliterella atlantica CENA595]
MSDETFSQFWQQLGEILALHPEAFEQINTQPGGSTAAIVVLTACLSQAVAQSVVLFANRVKPLRFVLTLLIGAIIFAFGYLFLVLSTWIISFAPFTVEAPFTVVERTLGASYAPLIFSLFGAMPYFGEPILSVLSFWHLLAIVVGFAAATHASLWQAFGTVGLGWLMLWVLQHTIGQPIANLGYWLVCKVAGVELVIKRQSFLMRLQQNLRAFPLPEQSPAQIVATGNSVVSPVREPENQVEPALSVLEPAAIFQNNAAIATSVSSKAPSRLWTIAVQARDYLISIGVTSIAIVLLSPIRAWWFAEFEQSSRISQFVVSLVWIGAIALVAAALLAPWETLGWWAGWLGDSLDPSSDSTQPQATSAQTPVTRYVVYLDGIGQSTLDYLSDSQAFVDALEHNLPQDIKVIKGIMPYSVRNNPLTENRPLAFLWRLADRFRLKDPTSVFGYFVNLRNVLAVAVSADKRYGLFYNLGIARIIYRSLIQHGYSIEQNVPITLIGFSGGGQMAAGAAQYLRQVLTAPIDIISLGGVISGNINILTLEHLYHLVGDKDGVERIGPIMFPGRWKLVFLSYWNRALRMGKVSRISLGPIGHQLPGGLMDAEQFLPDGQSHLQQTLDRVREILLSTADSSDRATSQQLSNYDRYQQAAFNQPQFYPIARSVASEHYRPIAQWMGRLILPPKDRRQTIAGVLFEVHHAPIDFQDLVGQIVTLRFSDDPQVQAYVQAVTKDVHFSPQAEHSIQQGRVHPTRLNHWRQVNPLESLAGAHPNDDAIVMLQDPVVVDRSTFVLTIDLDPVQITGRYYGLVKFVQPIQPGDLFVAIHFDRTSGQFTGAKETVYLPQVVANQNDTYSSTSQNIEQSPLNDAGWYIYGAPDESGRFIVQALAPRSLLQVEPNRQIVGGSAVKHYLKKEAWDNLAAQKGQISKVILSYNTITENTISWQEGKRALLVHIYGGIGGKKTEPAAKSPLYFGHFAYGIAKVVRDPLADELRFEIVYHQIYTHNHDGLIAGSLHWSRYMGDRQFGWLGLRPVSDTILELDAFTGDYETDDGEKKSPLDRLIYQLQIMAARYRIGDGTGGTFVGPAYNCTQDSNQALYAAMRQIVRSLRSHPNVQQWKQEHPDQLHRLEQLEQLSKELKRLLLPWGIARADWKNQAEVLGSTLEDRPLSKIRRSLLSWRTILPRLTSDDVTQAFLKQGGSAWVLRTNQVGGNDLDIEPIAPMTL